jgi:hypothetical protein
MLIIRYGFCPFLGIFTYRDQAVRHGREGERKKRGGEREKRKKQNERQRGTASSHSE